MFLPVVERELRMAARRRATYRLRFYSVLALLAVLCYNLISSRFRSLPASQFGLELFAYLSLSAFIFSALAGVIATSDCVSKEKREGTLGLLFLTDLKGYDIIYGKLAANALHAFYALVGILPIVGIPLLLGGVTAPQFVRVSLALVTTVVFSLTVGIFVSTHSRDERKATVFTFLILAVVTVVPFVLFITYQTPRMTGPERDSWLSLCCSPGFSLAAAVNPTTFWPAYAYWFSLLWLWAMSACLLAWSSVRLPRMTGEEENQRLAAFRQALQIRFHRFAGAPRQWLDVSPFFWLAMRGEASRWRVWFFVASILGIWLTFWKGLGVFIFDWTVVSAVIGILHLVLKIWLAAEASRRFLEERKNNTFELLLSTPLSRREMIGGQWLALWKQFGRPGLALLVLQIALMLVDPRSFHDDSGENRLPTCLAGMFFLVADCVALGWVGMWFGLNSRTRVQAVLSSLALVLVSRALIVGAVMRFAAASIVGYPPTGLSQSETLWTVCFGSSIDLVVIILARSSLLRNFRQMAAAQLSLKK